MKLSELTKYKGFLTIVAINVAVFILAVMFPEMQVMQRLALGEGELPGLLGVIHLFTHMFAHANLPHLMGNMFFVSPFALYLENRIGCKKFLQYWILTGLGASALFLIVPSLLPWGYVLGASGACSGIMASACMLDNEDKFIRALGLCAFLYIFLSQVYSAFVAFIYPTGVAYIAHVGGMVAGLMVMHFIKPCNEEVLKGDNS